MAAQPLHLSWFNPVQLQFGPASLQQLPQDCDVVVLADRRALGYEHETALLERLGARCKAWSWMHSGLASVEQARLLCAEVWPVLQSHPDAVILAIGGGTTLDMAKVVRYRLDPHDLEHAARHWRSNSLPASYVRHALWAVPTTAGTGSEVTRWATVWDTAATPPVKLSWAPAQGFADRAFIDPDLTRTCPVRVTRDCGLDTLAHALESLWNQHANALTAALGLRAAQTVIHTLPALLQDPEDAQARTAMAQASLLAGLAMSQTQTALAHALSYELTLQENLPHGEACAVWLPMVWELALGRSALCDAHLAQVFGGTAAQGVPRLLQWLAQMGVICRDLRQDADGVTRLVTEMQSTRGRNFIGQYP